MDKLSRVWCRVPGVCCLPLLFSLDLCWSRVLWGPAGVTEFRKVVTELQAVPRNRTRMAWLCPAVPCAGISSLLEGLWSEIEFCWDRCLRAPPLDMSFFLAPIVRYGLTALLLLSQESFGQFLKIKIRQTFHFLKMNFKKAQLVDNKLWVTALKYFLSYRS